MSVLRNVLRDLVEKRLWPVAVALVALAAAVPVLLGGGGSSAPAAAPASAGAPAPAPPSTSPSPTATTASLIHVGNTPPARRNRAGKLRDPFSQPKAAAATTTTSAGQSGRGASTATPATPGSGTVSPSGGGTPGPSGGGGTGAPTHVPPTPGPAPAPEQDVYRVDLRFGLADHKRDLIRDIPRLTPLPSKRNPFFVFLGVLKDGKTSVFLVSSDAKATGDGKCRPSKRDCQTIELQPGDTEYFDVAAPDGTTPGPQYWMYLRSIKKDGVPVTVAKAAYQLHSRAGEKVVRAAADQVESQQVRAYHYRPADGVLVRARSAEAGTALARLRTFEFRPGEVDVFRSRPARSPAG